MKMKHSAKEALKVDAETSLLSAVAIGSTVLPVEEKKHFVLGRKVVIDPGTVVQEVNEIASFGSIILKYPLQHPHGSGANIVMPAPGSPLPPMPTTTMTSTTTTVMRETLFGSSGNFASKHLKSLQSGG